MVTFVTGQSALEDEQLDHVIEANAGVHTTSMHTTRTAERDMVPEQERALEVDGYCGALQLRELCATIITAQNLGNCIARTNSGTFTLAAVVRVLQC